MHVLLSIALAMAGGLVLSRVVKLFGVTLMLWICIQFYMFPPNGNRVQKVDPSCRGSGDSDRGPACQLLADKQQNDHP